MAKLEIRSHSYCADSDSSFQFITNQKQSLGTLLLGVIRRSSCQTRLVWSADEALRCRQNLPAAARHSSWQHHSKYSPMNYGLTVGLLADRVA